MIDRYRDTATHDKLIFPTAITHILSHVHITTPLSSPFYVMGSISKESIRKSDAQLATKWPRMEDDATPTPRPSSYFAPSSSSSRVEASLATIMDQLQHMHADFGSHLLRSKKSQCCTKAQRNNTKDWDHKEFGLPIRKKGEAQTL